MKNGKLIVVALLVLATALSLVACSSSSTATPAPTPTPVTPAAPKTRVDDILAAGKLKVGTSLDYPPFEFWAEIDGVATPSGIDILIGQRIAEKMGVEFDLIDMAFDGLLIGLDEDKFDLVLAGMSATDERKRAVDFTVDTVHSTNMVVIRKEDDALYNTGADFTGKMVGSQSGSIYTDVALTMNPDVRVRELVGFVDLIIELQAKKLDAVVANYMTATAYVSGNDDLIVKDVGIEYDSPGQAAAVKKGQPEFVEYLNVIITEMKADGSLDKFIADSVALANAHGLEMDD